jgi:predicted  nucleic acid-binding Zn-ribbon protein
MIPNKTDKAQSLIDLKKRVETAQQEASEAKGSLKQVMKQIKDGFGCSTLKDAKLKLKKLEKKAEQLEETFQTSLDEFEEKWDELLDEQDV